jgi:hypothetical protein
MNRQALLKEMRDSVGTKDPIEFFTKLTDVFTLLFDRIDELEERVAKSSAVAIATSHWDPRVASDMLADQVKKLRESDKDTYATEISALKIAFAEDKVTQNYETFVKFWQETLGFHPFLD